VDLPEWHGADLVLGNLPGTPRTYDESSSTLAGWEARIYRRTRG
jgi:oligo-1,6-glucosidase